MPVMKRPRRRTLEARERLLVHAEDSRHLGLRQAESESQRSGKRAVVRGGEHDRRIAGSQGERDMVTLRDLPQSEARRDPPRLALAALCAYEFEIDHGRVLFGEMCPNESNGTS